jgi:hypothetical protein
MNKIYNEDSNFTKIFNNFENFLNEEKKFFEEETFKTIEKEIEALIISNKPLDINSTNISKILKSKKNIIITNVKQSSKELKENLKFDLIEKSQKFFNEKNLNEYRDKEKNEKIRILKFNDDESFFYFGETLSDVVPDVMEGFGFRSNEKENEFFLGNFKNDNFIKGIWINGKNNVFLGEFYYNDINEKHKKTNFKGLMLNKLEQKSNFLFGEFDFDKSNFTGISLKLNNSDNNYIILDSGSFKNNKRNCKDMISLIINDDIKEKNSNNNSNYNFKLKIASYEDDIIIDDHYIMDDNSLIKIKLNKDKNKDNNNSENNNIYFSEFILDENIIYRGEFNNENLRVDEIKPIFQGKGILIDAKDNIRYKGNFKKGKKEGPKETLFLLYSVENNNNNFTLKKFEGEFKSDNFIKGNISENDQKFIENGEFDENFILIKGTLYHEKSESYTGDFKYNKREGNGKYIYEDKKEYDGEWKKGDRHGRGTLYMEDKNKFILGDWENNNLFKIIETTLDITDVEKSDLDFDLNKNSKLVSIKNDNYKEKEKEDDDKYKSPKNEKRKEIYIEEIKNNPGKNIDIENNDIKNLGLEEKKERK